MPRFFLPGLCGERAVLTGEDARHIAKVLRMRPGEEITLCDTQGFDYRCLLEEVAPAEVCARVLERRTSESECRAEIVLYQALPKGDKLDFIVQKATELGVSAVVPVLTEHCVSRPDAKAMKNKTERLQRIALEAAKQCGRGKIPQIRPLETFLEAVTGMKQAHTAILCYEKATAPLSGMVEAGASTIALMVGSEGGFAPEEAHFAEEQGVRLASLGKRILRCETAPVSALSVILCKTGEM